MTAEISNQHASLPGAHDLADAQPSDRVRLAPTQRMLRAARARRRLRHRHQVALAAARARTVAAGH